MMSSAATVNETQLSHASSTEAPQQSSSPVKKAVTVSYTDLITLCNSN